MDITEKNETKLSYALNNFQGFKYCQQTKRFVCCCDNSDVQK